LIQSIFFAKLSSTALDFSANVESEKENV